jgi:hypothetical protein
MLQKKSRTSNFFCAHIFRKRLWFSFPVLKKKYDSLYYYNIKKTLLNHYKKEREGKKFFNLNVLAKIF